MSRALFLQRLRQGLSGLPPAEVEEIVSDYEFHFAEAGDAGKNEEETAAELGDPVRIAREIASQRNLGSARRGGAAGRGMRHI